MTAPADVTDWSVPVLEETNRKFAESEGVGLGKIGPALRAGDRGLQDLRVALGLIAAFKVKSAAAVIQGHSNVGEKLSHALIIGALIAARLQAFPTRDGSAI